MGPVGPPALHFSMSTENFVAEVVSRYLGDAAVGDLPSG